MCLPADRRATLTARLAGAAVGARAGSAARLARRHAVFAVAMAGAAALRAAVMIGYPPAMWFNDSYSYVFDAVHHLASSERPSGYPLLLAALEPLRSFAVVAACQHLLGLGMGAACYALLRRRGLPGWAAALAALPVLYDAYQVQLEQQIMSDTVFMAAALAAVVIACWQDAPRWPPLAAAGALAGYATLVRSAGLVLVPVMAACLLPRGGWRRGWRGAAVFLAAGAVPIAAYAGGYQLQHGRYALTESGGVFLYGRVMSFADCAVMRPPPSLARLCDPRPPQRRPIAVEYIWSPTDPLRKLGPGHLFTPRVDSLAGQFAERAILAQPGEYARVVAADTLRAFAWSRDRGYDRVTTRLYNFSDPPPRIPAWAHWPALRAYQPGLAEPRAIQPLARFLRAYQREVYLRGTLLGALLLIGLAGLAARWRHWGGLGLLPWTVAVALLVLPAATSGFSYRYLLAVTPFACVAAGLAFSRAGGPRDAEPSSPRRAHGEARLPG